MTLDPTFSNIDDMAERKAALRKHAQDLLEQIRQHDVPHSGEPAEQAASRLADLERTIELISEIDSRTAGD